jgi:probable F420-dependent oxidoreductase
MPRPLRVGVQLPEVEREVRWPEMRRTALAAEAAGFDSIWVGDHLLYRGDGGRERGPYDAWSMLAALAACTSRVELGPLVTCTAFRAPAVLAKMAMSVDDVSGGRLVLALGCGWNRTEFEAFGVPFDDRVGRFEEAFGVIHRLLSGERVTFSGRYVDIDDAVLLPAPQRRPRLMVGSNGRRMLAATLPQVDAWNTWWDDYGNTPDGFAHLNSRISAEAERVGRSPGEIARSACVLVRLDPASTERRVPDGIEPLEGSPEQLAAVLRAFARAGADEVILVVLPINEESVSRLGEVLEVLDA